MEPSHIELIKLPRGSKTERALAVSRQLGKLIEKMLQGTDHGFVLVICDMHSDDAIHTVSSIEAESLLVMLRELVERIEHEIPNRVEYKQ